MKKLLHISVLGMVMFIFINAGNDDDDSSVSWKTTNAHPSSTGAPGELTCSRAGCHNGPIFNGIGINAISFGNNDTGYVPGTVYNMKISVTNPDTKKFGFQILAMKDADSTSVGTFIITDNTRTQLQDGDVAFGLQSRKYVTHKSAGTQTGTPGYIEWSFNWEAPASDEGTITFYLATQVTNNNNQNTGDTVYLLNKTISFIDTTNEDTTNSFISLTSPLNEIKVSPNPAKEKVNVAYTLNFPEEVEIDFFDVRGKLLASHLVKGRTGAQLLTINTLQYPRGIYFVSLKTSGGIYAKKLILQ